MNGAESTYSTILGTDLAPQFVSCRTFMDALWWEQHRKSDPANNDRPVEGEEDWGYQLPT